MDSNLCVINSAKAKSSCCQTLFEFENMQNFPVRKQLKYVKIFRDGNDPSIEMSKTTSGPDLSLLQLKFGKRV